MSISTLVIVLLGLTVIGYYLGRARSVRAVSGQTQNLHSLPAYYGYYVAVWCGLPALFLTLVWVAVEPGVIRALLVASLGAASEGLSPQELGLMVNDVQNLAKGGVVSREASPAMQAAADYYNLLRFLSHLALAVLAFGLAIGGLTYAWKNIQPHLRARNIVENVLIVALIVCSTIAILTTIGIVLSLIFESGRFFTRISPIDFLFGTEWSPQIALRAGQVGGSGLLGERVDDKAARLAANPRTPTQTISP